MGHVGLADFEVLVKKGGSQLCCGGTQSLTQLESVGWYPVWSPRPRGALLQDTLKHILVALILDIHVS